MEKNKKKYVKPAMQAYGIEPTTLLGESSDRGSLYDGIGFSGEYCTNPE